MTVSAQKYLTEHPLFEFATVVSTQTYLTLCKRKPSIKLVLLIMCGVFCTNVVLELLWNDSRINKG